MEQTNLVVTADGKTWDEVTRDTSYMGILRLYATTTTNYTTWNETVILDDLRGFDNNNSVMMNKDFLIAYDRFICLVEGEYNIRVKGQQNVATGTMAPLYINGTQKGYNHFEISGSTGNTSSMDYYVILKRGDEVQVKGAWGSNPKYNNFSITRL